MHAKTKTLKAATKHIFAIDGNIFTIFSTNYAIFGKADKVRIVLSARTARNADKLEEPLITVNHPVITMKKSIRFQGSLR